MIQIKTEPYNPKRFGRPWVAVLTLEGRADLQYEWGQYEYIADSYGGSGRLELYVQPGQAVLVGQTDHRGNKSKRDYYIVGPFKMLMSRTKREIIDHLREEKEKPEDDQRKLKAIRMVLQLMDDENLTIEDLEKEM